MGQSDAVKPSWGKRLYGVEGLRGIAAFTVLIAHTQQRSSPEAGGRIFGTVVELGGQGLTLFFALSGFLLYRPFASAIMGYSNTPDLRNYVINRALRIFPAYIVIFLLASLVLGVAYLRPVELGEYGVTGPQPVGYLTDPGLLLANLSMLHTFFPEAIKTGIPVAWSLTVEIVFYAAMPLMALLCVRFATTAKARSRLAWAPVAAMIFISTIGHTWHAFITKPTTPEEAYFLEWGGSWEAVLARSFFTHADLFAYGMAAAAIALSHSQGHIRASTLRWIKVSWIGAGVALLPVGLVVGHISLGFGVLSGVIILVAVTPNRVGDLSAFTRVLESKPLANAGLISYSVYLWHMPLIVLLVKHGLTFPDTVPGLLGNVLVVFVLTVALSTVTYRWVEKPPLRLKKKPGSRKPQTDHPEATPQLHG